MFSNPTRRPLSTELSKKAKKAIHVQTSSNTTIIEHQHVSSKAETDTQSATTQSNATASIAVTYGGIDKESFTHLIEHAGPYVRKLFRPKVHHLSKKKLEIVVPYLGHHVGNFAVPCLHSGSVASMIDHVGSFASWACLDDGFSRVRTADLRVDHLAPPPLEDLRYIATIIHRSKSLVRTDIVVWDKFFKKKVAVGRAAFHITRSNVNLSDSLQEAAEKKKNKKDIASNQVSDKNETTSN